MKASNTRFFSFAGNKLLFVLFYNWDGLKTHIKCKGLHDADNRFTLTVQILYVIFKEGYFRSIDLQPLYPTEALLPELVPLYKLMSTFLFLVTEPIMVREPTKDRSALDLLHVRSIV